MRISSASVVTCSSGTSAIDVLNVSSVFTNRAPSSSQDTPSALAAAQEEHRLLLQGLRRLPLELQISLELHFWEGMSGRELAEVLDVSEGTVRSRLRRAKEQLARHIDELTQDAALVESTLTNLDRWATSLREQLAAARP